jgi:hypothetical protein
MRKISLDVSKLRVESFETVDGKSDARGTVHGYYTEITCPMTQCGQECQTGFHYPCRMTAAFTDGEVMCPCASGTPCIG